jgi:UDP-glucose 4-epimerase
VKKILLTGGAGFIGYSLAQVLSKKFRITILDIKKKDKLEYEILNFIKKKKINYYRSLKFIKKKKFDYVFHLAATLGVKKVYNNPYNTFVNNTFPLIEILNYCKNKVKVIFFSTSEVYSPLIHLKKTRFPIKEDQDLLISSKIIKRDAYYLSKIFCEKILEIKNSNFIILRPHNIYGPSMGNSHVIPNLINKLNKRQKKVSVYSPSHTRAFCYIDDAVNQIVRLAFSKKNNGKVFNIGNQSEEIKIFDLAKKIKHKLNSASKLTKNKNTEGSPVRRVPSMKKTLKVTGYKNKFSLDQGIDKTIKWYIS